MKYKSHKARWVSDLGTGSIAALEDGRKVLEEVDCLSFSRSSRISPRMSRLSRLILGRLRMPNRKSIDLEGKS
jgi:hypothetical protein